jgi:hypothetical protein
MLGLAASATQTTASALDDVLLDVRTEIHGYASNDRVVVADLDGDGRPDLAFMGQHNTPGSPFEFRVNIVLSSPMPRPPVDLELEEPDGLIREGTPRGEYSWVRAADVDGDGHLDLVIQAVEGSTKSWYEVYRGPFHRGYRRDTAMELPDCMWTGVRAYVSDPPSVGDVNGDGRADILFSERLTAAGNRAAYVTVFGTSPLPRSIDLGDPMSPHVLRVGVPASRDPAPPQLVDFDGDGLDEWVLEEDGFLVLRDGGIRQPGVTGLLMLPPPSPLAIWPIVSWTDPAVYPRSVPAACGIGDAVLVDAPSITVGGVEFIGGGFVFEPRPRAFWEPQPPAAPDQVLHGPPGVAATFLPFLLADLDGDGFRDAAMRNPQVADATMSAPGNGVVVARSLGGVQPAVVVLDGTASLRRSADADSVEWGKMLSSGDFDGDGLDDIVIGAGFDRPFPALNDGLLRVLKGGARWTDVPDGAGCAEVVRVEPGAAATTSPAAADAAVAAWGRVDDPGRAFDPLVQIEPVRQAAMPGDPVLHVDGGQLKGVLSPSDPAGLRGAYRGLLARTGSGSIVAEVPAAPGAVGAHLLCLSPRNRPPLVEAGPDRVIAIDDAFATDCAGEILVEGVTHDLDCDEVTAWWEEEGVVLGELTSAIRLAVGVHDLTLVARDAFEAASDSVSVTVIDGAAPKLSAHARIACLWPPDHRLVDVQLGRDILVAVRDNCDPTPAVRIASVTSSEVENGSGDGNTSPDVVIVSDDLVRVRRERSGGGEGRIYSILLEAVDDAGNVEHATVELVVPRDMSDRSCRRVGRAAAIPPRRPAR